MTSSTPVRRTSGGEMTRWNPWAEMFPLSRMDELVDRMWQSMGMEENVPRGSLEETDDAYVLELDLPGIQKDDITVEVTGRRVTIHGERKEKEREGVLRHTTRITGKFNYEIVLPGEISGEQVTASMDDGVLSVRAPKASAGKATKIEIK